MQGEMREKACEMDFELRFQKGSRRPPFCQIRKENKEMMEKETRFRGGK